ncbi:unnamed protein product [Alopecurus aequalis]
MSSGTLDFLAAKCVPESHVWTEPKEYPVVSESVAGHDAVPVVDLADPSDDAIAAVARAAEEWGGFLLVGHGVSTELLTRVAEQSERLFARPAPEKERAARGGAVTNGYGDLPFGRYFSRRMWSEGYTVAAADVRSEFRRVWPDGGDDYHRFWYVPNYDVMEEFHKEMRALGDKVLDMFYKALGLTADQIAGGEAECEIRDTMTATMQLNMYPKCPEPERAIGLAPHTDSGFFTFILPSLVPGLQLLRLAPKRWVTVPPLPGALPVVIGDLFHVLTNGRFHNVLHRAVVNKDRHRVTLTYFLGPPKDMKVAPLRASILPGSKASFHAVTWPDYMVVRDKMFGKDASALSVLKVTEDGEEAELAQWIN